MTAYIYIQYSRISATLQHFIIIRVTFRARVLAENDGNDMNYVHSLTSNSKKALDLDFFFKKKKAISSHIGVINKFCMRNEIRIIELRNTAEGGWNVS